MSRLKEELIAVCARGGVFSQIGAVVEGFYESYAAAVGKEAMEKLEELFLTYFRLIVEQIEAPYAFSPFHTRITEPFDYYKFGLEVFRPLVDFSRSKIVGTEILDTITEQLLRGENVILLANHQTEPDPQAISLLLEEQYPKLAREMIFMAGHRVTTDPLAVPLSKGCNLLCIYSKRRVEYPPEEKEQKLLHNQRTLQMMANLLDEGGRCIYVAPSGGRDRRNPEGDVDVDPFNPQSVEMFRLIALQAKRPTHFYPFSLYTYPLLPPPEGIDDSPVERRTSSYTPIYLGFGKEIDIEHIPGCEGLGRRERRVARATYIWKLVRQQYHSFFYDM